MTEGRAAVHHFNGFEIGPMSMIAARTLGPQLANIDPWARYGFAATALTNYLAVLEAGAPHYAIKVDGAMAGAIGVKSDWLRGPYLQFLGILPAYQGRGIGTAILGWLEREARRAGARNLWVAASEFNHPALAFYERHGFNRIANLSDLIADGYSEILFRKRLIPS